MKGIAWMMGKYLFIVISFIGCWFIGVFLANVCYANQFPPIGKRIYLIEAAGQQKDLVKIRPEGSFVGRGKYLRDPLLPGENEDLSLSGTQLEPRQIVGKPMAEKPAHLTFSPRNVKGKYSKPRVKFLVKEAPVTRVDEPYKLEYLPRVYDTASELDIDL